MGAADDALKLREAGLARTGTVGLRDFDVGVIDTLAGTTRIENDDQTVAPVGIYTQPPGVCPPDGYPGVAIVFAFPEDVVRDYKVPFIHVRRDEVSAALERWHSEAATQYRAPGDGALPISVKAPGGSTLTGFDRYEELPQAWPYDIVYTVSVKARFRGATSPTQRNNLNALFQYVMRVFPPYGKVNVVDSIGDLRTYEAYNEGIANLDGIGEVQDRILGMAITLRVEGELDLKDPFTARAVKALTLRSKPI